MSQAHYVNGIRTVVGGRRVTEVIDNATLNATTDVGKTLYVTVASKTITLPALSAGALYIYTIVNGCADGSLLTISPNSADGVSYITQVDDKDLINTALTAKQGDFVTLSSASLGVFWVVTNVQGIWAKEG